jgi:hypothetical protein
MDSYRDWGEDLRGIFDGDLDGLFEGDFDGDLLGLFDGDFDGQKETFK